MCKFTLKCSIFQPSWPYLAKKYIDIQRVLRLIDLSITPSHRSNVFILCLFTDSKVIAVPRAIKCSLWVPSPSFTLGISLQLPVSIDLLFFKKKKKKLILNRFHFTCGLKLKISKKKKKKEKQNKNNKRTENKNVI